MPAGEEDPRSRRRMRRRNAAQARAPDRCMGEDVYAQPVEWSRQRHIGVIKHFDPEKRYGFIACHEIKEDMQKDVFVHERQLNNFQMGDQVQFRLKMSNKGLPQATDLREVVDYSPYCAPARSCSGGATGSRDEATFSENAGVHVGQVKKIEKGYGFLACEELFVMFGYDVFVEKDQIAGFQVGDTVRFSIKVNHRDQPQAVDLVRVGDARLGVPTAPDGDLRENHSRPLPGSLHEGFVKKIDVEKGYGFITSQELFNYYQADVYVDKRELPGFAVGDRVVFTMKVNKRGQPQACSVCPVTVEDERVLDYIEVGLHDDSERALALKDGPSEEHLAGTIKSFDAENGYGFISSPEIMERYKRDVFLHSKQIGNFKPGDHVTFSVSQNQHGRPQAHDLKLAPSTVAWLAGGADAEQPTSESNPEHVGDIKSFNAAKGYGFIECPALFGQFGRDVFIHQNQFDGRKVGDRVSFKVLVNNKGQPQACEVVLVAEAERVANANSTSIGRERHSPNEFEGCAPEELDRKLLRACASARMESLETMDKLLLAGANPNSRDVTGQLALVVSSLNVRNSERKCRLLLEHKADVQAMHNDALTVVQWARERINGNFATYLEAVSKGEATEYVVVLNQDAPEEY